ncbi:unnamed protein product [Didymodactylos carnosus]|uniref:PNPLA domain-containing protein n=1 Tax=Didymodactylos carnosus TaxID=1234261 RepID=A0A815YPV3_9BILA|nr:unnamed protein product [Didymodactylos carnosus]CAF1572749.1 unnamed protein product [Didymodactylos carnosus]CAF3809220.1 unnamed protein product [Didymodactylos carnosus]CAF4436575.1 unnamed protein product [Didymodactylos carnosus]
MSLSQNDNEDETPFAIPDEPIIHPLEIPFNILDIRKIKTDDTLVDCERPELIHDNNINESEVLNQLLRGALQKRGDDLTVCRLFYVRDLRKLSLRFKVKFQLCTVEEDSEHHYVFKVDNNGGEEMEDVGSDNEADNKKEDDQIGHQLKIIYTVVYENNIIALCISSNSYLYDIHRELDRYPKDALLYFELACYYQRRPEQNNSLGTWQYACWHYRTASKLRMDSTRINLALLGYCRCLVKLSKYTYAITQLEKLSRKKSTSELWYLLAIAYRKTWQIGKAVKAVKECLELEPGHQGVVRQQTLMELRQRRLTEYRQQIQNTRIENKFTNALFSAGRLEEVLEEKKKQSLERQQYDWTRRLAHQHQNTYNILSIDGGGFRGLIPAIWLREIEKRTNRSISDIFQMMAGTSTGAIIACGLSVHNNLRLPQPAYEAKDIVDLYVNRAPEIFVPATRRRLLYRWATQSSKYARTGRQSLFNHYFGNNLICNCLTDIVVPAVLADRTHTHLFTRYDSRTGNVRPTRIVDILMSTTAAPTFFRPHAFNYSAYVDGGVQMNNPTMAAFSEALRYGHQNQNIFVLSLGTGDYIHAPLRRPTANRHSCFWLRNNKLVLKNLFEIQQNNVDYQMDSILGNRNYHRWQVWFEDEILLDKYNRETRMLLEDHANDFLDELEGRDDDKRLGFLIDRLS